MQQNSQIRNSNNLSSSDLKKKAGSIAGIQNYHDNRNESVNS